MAKICLDNSEGGSLHMKKMSEEATKLIEMVANNQYLYSSERNPVNFEASQKTGILEVDTLDAILAQNKIMSQQISVLTQHLSEMQVSAINAQNTPQEALYDMNGGFNQGSDTKVNEESVEKEAPKEKNEEVEHAHPRRADNPFPVSSDTHPTLPKAPEYKPNMPYPQRLQKASKDKGLWQMPLYAKFMKELLSNKRNWKEIETVVLTKECSAIIQHKLPEKMQDLGSFVIPCTIRDVTIQRVLCDLGASINLMPLSLMRKLQIDEFPLGVVEDLLVRVGSFIFPIDFVILDMEEDKNASIILGRPFLVTGRALIDVQKGELTLRVNDEEVVLNVFEAIKHPNDHEGCMRIDVVKPLVQEVFEAEALDDALDSLSEDNLLEIDDSPPLKDMSYTCPKLRKEFLSMS
ncbi:uncharacterized protein LOC130962730 [Arachis stenosperma]|uniref:uncharacterized protein LOC130962730 n=1 Tax=Arachis stenosperma TaxID=217475 RepID=UPI0025AB6018|nr:uncharacterized protein LOC130962730 [Arachis stenosperma]